MAKHHGSTTESTWGDFFLGFCFGEKVRQTAAGGLFVNVDGQFVIAFDLMMETICCGWRWEDSLFYRGSAAALEILQSEQNMHRVFAAFVALRVPVNAVPARSLYAICILPTSRFSNHGHSIYIIINYTVYSLRPSSSKFQPQLDHLSTAASSQASNLCAGAWATGHDRAAGAKLQLSQGLCQFVKALPDAPRCILKARSYNWKCPCPS